MAYGGRVGFIVASERVGVNAKLVVRISVMDPATSSHQWGVGCERFQRRSAIYMMMEELSDLKLRSKLYYYAAEVTEVYDGDTITINLDLGLSMWRTNQKIRLWKINAPEVRGPEREEGLRVRDFVRDLILGKPVLIRTILDKHGADRTGKYGRLLGEVLVEGEAGESINVNQLLLDRGLVKPMTEEGSLERAVARQIACPYCGETRQVEAGLVQLCPNCFDEPYAL